MSRFIFSNLFRCWTIGRFFGVAVRIHWSFWILPLVALFVAWPYGVAGVAYSEALVFALFVTVVLHEYGHILMARVFGIGTEDVIMTPLGGMARMRTMAKEPFREIAIAVAGPAVNVVLGGMIFVPLVVAAMMTGKVIEPIVPTNWFQLLAWVFIVNVSMLVFNMLPLFPSDGGRVFRATLSVFLDRVRATQIAVTVGTVAAMGLAIVGIFNQMIQLPLVVVMLAVFGHMELWMVKREAAMQKGLWVDSRRPLPEHAIEFYAPEPGFSGYSMDRQTGMWVEWRQGVPVRLCRMRGW